MKKKLFSILISGIMLSVSASAQTIKENIDKAKNDKNAERNSAKADVIIHKNIIADSAITKTTPVKTVIKAPGGSSMKQKKHKNKGKFKKSSK